jgi:predicted nucleic acid-binding protein
MNEIVKSQAVRANCLDASALVKLYVKEDGSDILQRYFQNEATRYTTPLCFYEALTTLKVKWLYRKEITKDDYLILSFSMAAWFSHVSRQIRDLDFLSPIVFRDARSIVERYGLDLSDAFQILSVKECFFSALASDSRTVLVTADKQLANAARQEGILAWYIMEEPSP